LDDLGVDRTILLKTNFNKNLEKDVNWISKAQANKEWQGFINTLKSHLILKIVGKALSGRWFAN